MSDSAVLPADARADVNADRRFLDADECAERFGGISKRHWNRLVDSGRAPQPTRFGRLVRWSLSTLVEWESGGCRPLRQPGRVKP